MNHLVHHPAPCPDESLASYLERLALLNRYDPASLLTDWLRTSPETGARVQLSSALRQPAFYQRVAAATGQPLFRVFALSPHRLAGVLLPPDVTGDELVLDGVSFPMFPSRRMWLFIRPAQDAVFCPGCLREAPYHHVVWYARGVAACPRHETWLIEHCPRCGAALPVPSIVAGCCVQCACDLTGYEAIPLAPDNQVLQSQACLDAWLKGEKAPSDLRLPTASGQVLYRVLDGLRSAIQFAPDNLAFVPGIEALPERSRARMTLRQAGAIYAAALQGLQDWPEGFFAFLDTYRQQYTTEHGLNTLGVLYSTWLENYWRHPAFSFVQDAFNAYLTSHFPPTRSILASKRYKRTPDLVGQFAYIDVRNAARLIGASPPKIKRLARDGLLDVYPETEVSRPGKFLYRRQLEALRDREMQERANQPDIPKNQPKRPRQAHGEFPGDLITKRQAADSLGVHPDLLNDLVADGLLVLSGRRQRGTELLPYLTTHDLDTFRDELSDHVSLRTQPGEQGILLGHAAILNGKVGLRKAGLIQRVLDGKLAAYHPQPDLHPLEALWFENTEVLSLTGRIKDENEWVSFMEVLALLSISRAILLLWMDSGLLVPVASFARAQYFSRSVVLDLRNRCMTSDEAAAMLGTSRAAMARWVQAGYLRPLNSFGKRYLFDRLALEDWCRTFVSTPETRKLLQAASGDLRRWCKEGKLVRISSGTREHGFYRRDQVLALQQELSLPDPVQKL